MCLKIDIVQEKVFLAYCMYTRIVPNINNKPYMLLFKFTKHYFTQRSIAAGTTQTTIITYYPLINVHEKCICSILVIDVQPSLVFLDEQAYM